MVFDFYFHHLPLIHQSKRHISNSFANCLYNHKNILAACKMSHQNDATALQRQYRATRKTKLTKRLNENKFNHKRYK